MTADREFDLVLYGASGFTGRLIAEYLAERYGTDGKLRWALAGRNADKIQRIAVDAGLPQGLPVISADSADPDALRALVARTRVVISAVGPYQLYGNELLAACAQGGTDYVDLCGEPNWMRAMIDSHSDSARASGARIVFSCGFDSIPSDLGVFYLQRIARERFGAPATDVRARVRAMQGGASGGTVASMQATMGAAAQDPAIGELLKDPFCLAPGHSGPRQPNSHKPCHDDDLDSWAAPFIMAVINIPNVHRSNALLGGAYGDNFRYSEMLLTGPGEKGESLANALAVPSLGDGENAPQPGEGPSREEQEAGFYDLLFIGRTDSGETVRASVKGDRDPGYGSTSRMIAESAVALALDDIPTGGGIWTPAAAMGDRLIERLGNNAGLVFSEE
jgi:short subunit dehydrogenase-like uncharacterized protein